MLLLCNIVSDEKPLQMMHDCQKVLLLDWETLSVLLPCQTILRPG